MDTFSFSGVSFSSNALLETIRDAEDPRKLMFAVWDGGKVTAVPYVECGPEKIFPPEANLNFVANLRLPAWTPPAIDPGDLFGDLGLVVSEFIDLSDDNLLSVRAQILATWYPHQSAVAPYLWLVGPFASGKSSFLRLLQCLCRQAIYVADIRASGLHKYINHGRTTLLFDEFDPGSSSCRALYPLLRAGSMPDAFVARDNGLGSLYGPKIFASRQLPGDAALESRSLVVRMYRTTKTLRRLDQEALDKIAAEFQNRLMLFRFTNSPLTAQENLPVADLAGLNPRTRDLAVSLMAPLGGNPEAIAQMLTIFKEHDDDVRLAQSLEPEWLAVETLFAQCHDRRSTGDSMSEMTIGNVASYLNSRLQQRGEDFKFSGRKIGVVLRGLGIRPIPLGNRGNGLRYTSMLKEQIHKLARQFNIDRRTIGYSGGLEAGYGGVPCALCEKFGVTGGLRFVDVSAKPRIPTQKNSRPPLLDPACRDEMNSGSKDLKQETEENCEGRSVAAERSEKASGVNIVTIVNIPRESMPSQVAIEIPKIAKRTHAKPFRICELTLEDRGGKGPFLTGRGTNWGPQSCA
jgi:hypothetical protein